MKKLMLALIVMLLLAFGGAAQAQDIPVFCGGLSDADCQIVTASQQAMMDAQSASASLNMDLRIDNIPDMPVAALAFNLSGQGAYALDPALLAKYAEADPMALLSDMTQLGTLMEEIFTAFSGQLSLTLTIPADLASQMSGGGMTIPEQLSVDLVMVDGIGYINLDQLAEALPGAGVPAGWYGLEIAKLFGDLFEMLAPMMGDMGSLPGMNMDSFSAFADPEFLNSYATIERLADSDGAAVFKTTLDFAALMSNPNMREMMRQQMELQGQTMTEADLDMALGMVEQMYDGLAMDMLQYINLSDSYTRRIEINMAWDLTSLMGMMGESGGAAPVMGMKVAVDYADFNAVAPITAPEGAAILTAEDAIQMFMGGMTPPSM